jgi:hypothetical protein
MCYSNLAPYNVTRKKKKKNAEDLSGKGFGCLLWARSARLRIAKHIYTEAKASLLRRSLAQVCSTSVICRKGKVVLSSREC